MARLPRTLLAILVCLLAAPAASMAARTPVAFSTGAPTNSIATTSRPGPSPETETADDFVLSDETDVSAVSFTGLVVPATSPTTTQLVVEIYRVFPLDSDTTRTSGSPTFSTSLVPTRVNSPSDAAFASRDSAAGQLSFTETNLGGFAALNSVQPGGIHAQPGNTTGGDGAVSGTEKRYDVAFAQPIDLPAGHYFLVPQVQFSSPTNSFLWLSAARPIAGAGTTPFTPDLQSWIRDANLDPDWLRIGTDIVGSGTFNASFSLSGNVACPAIAVSPATLPDATQGAPYAPAFVASGGASPYTFAESGVLPAGLSFNPDGTIAGAPTQVGSFPFTVTATDANGCTGKRDVVLNVVAPPATDGSHGNGFPTTGPPPADTHLAIAPSTFRAAGRGVKRSGTTVSYDDSQAAVTTFTVRRGTTGVRRGGRCVRRSRHRHGRRCTLFVVVRGSFGHRDVAGHNRLRFTGRLRGRRLAPARYRLRAVPALSGKPGTGASAGFRIRR